MNQQHQRISNCEALVIKPVVVATVVLTVKKYTIRSG